MILEVIIELCSFLSVFLRAYKPNGCALYRLPLEEVDSLRFHKLFYKGYQH